MPNRAFTRELSFFEGALLAILHIEGFKLLARAPFIQPLRTLLLGALRLIQAPKTSADDIGDLAVLEVTAGRVVADRRGGACHRRDQGNSRYEGLHRRF